jgi:hypothetical protein
MYEKDTLEKDKITGIIGWGFDNPKKEWLKRDDGSEYPFMTFVLRRKYTGYMKNKDTHPDQKIKVILPSNEEGLRIFDSLYEGRNVTVVGSLVPDGFIVDGNAEDKSRPEQFKTVIKTKEIEGTKVKAILGLTMQATAVIVNTPHVFKQGQYILKALSRAEEIEDPKSDDYGNITSGIIHLTVERFNEIIKAIAKNGKRDSVRPSVAEQTPEESTPLNSDIPF